MTATRRLEFIARTQLTGTAASVSFATGLSGFTKFFLVCYVVNDANAGGFGIQINTDNAANYAEQNLFVDGATIASARRTVNSLNNIVGQEASLDASAICLSVIEVSKPVAVEVARITSRSALKNTAGIQIYDSAIEWTNTSAVISRIDIVKSSNNITTGTRIVLWGSKD